MRLRSASLALCLFACRLDAETAAPPTALSASLRPGVPVDVFVSPGRATTILFQTGQKVAAISLASPVVTYKYDRSLNELEITPAVRGSGVETNLNLRIGANVYILLIRVVNDVRAQFFRRFSLEDDPDRDDEASLDRIRPLRPDEVDIVGCARDMERAGTDPVFCRAHPALRIEALSRIYPWNGCLVALEDVGQFLDRDLLVFRVQWVNRTADALYLDPRQYALYVRGRKIPIISRFADAGLPVIRPGELETVYLAVQGYRLSRDNDWQLSLPPDGDAVERLMER